MRISKRVLKILGVVVAVVLCNELLIFGLEPFASRVASKWLDFYEMQDVDTVILGDSLAETAVNPLVLDKSFGSISCNLGTTQQEIEEAYLGLRTVLEKRDISLVVLGVDLAYLQSDTIAHPGKPFLREKNKFEPLATSLADIAYLLPNSELYKTADSINWLFPYVSNHVKPTLGRIARNVRYKLQTTESVQDVSAQYSDMGAWLGQGYCNRDTVFNFSQGSQNTYRDIFDTKELYDKKLGFLKQICELCQREGVQLVVIHPPLARHNVLDYGETWFEQTDVIRQLVEENGGTFYDFNLAKTDLFSFDESFYYDTQHLNIEGAKHFTKALATVLTAQRDGVDCSAFFYTPGEYRTSFDAVAFVQVDAERTDSGASLTARAVVGDGQESEYQFLVRRKGDKHWELLRDYDTNPTCDFSPAETGTYQIVVNSRIVGSNEKFEKFRLVTVKV